MIIDMEKSGKSLKTEMRTWKSRCEFVAFKFLPVYDTKHLSTTMMVYYSIKWGLEFYYRAACNADAV